MVLSLLPLFPPTPCPRHFPFLLCSSCVPFSHLGQNICGHASFHWNVVGLPGSILLEKQNLPFSAANPANHCNSSSSRGGTSVILSGLGLYRSWGHCLAAGSSYVQLPYCVHRHCFRLLTRHVWLLLSFCCFLHQDPWACGGGSQVYMLTLGHHLFSAPW